jgi:hypothetical protein
MDKPPRIRNHVVRQCRGSKMLTASIDSSHAISFKFRAADLYLASRTPKAGATDRAGPAER